MVTIIRALNLGPISTTSKTAEQAMAIAGLFIAGLVAGFIVFLILRTARRVHGEKGGEEFHVGPHLMIVSPHQDEIQGLNRDPSNGMPYVAHLPNRTELYLVMPIRQWMTTAPGQTER
jgi:hypothetical protein